MSVPAELIRSEGGKIVLLVIDGLGGLPHPETRRTELETANIPNLDALARRSSVGRVQLLPTGLTPGSGPGHLSLFGYDPMTIEFGRGALEALGSDYPLADGEVAARGNYCSLDGDGRVTDRRAGRPSDEENRRLCALLEEKIQLDEGAFQLLPGKQHRFTLVLRGDDLGASVRDNDPQVEGKHPLPFVGEDARSQRTAGMLADFAAKTQVVLADEAQANGVLLRGFSLMPPIQPYEERFGLRAGAVAIYPMYRGVARLVGMDVLDAGTSLATQIERCRTEWNDRDFFFIHTKDTDTAGHSGEFDQKVAALEAIDAEIPQLVDLGADVIAITGDHSTPCIHLEHSWHPVPLILSSNRCIPVDDVTFDERGVLRGDIGTIRGHELLPLALAHAGRLDKFGA